MAEKTEFVSLKGQFLIAMPSLEDKMFNKSLVYLLEHTAKGAMGLILNKPMDVAVDEILEQVDENYNGHQHPEWALSGGPVDTGRGFVFHKSSEKEQWIGEMPMGQGISVTASVDILKALVDDQTIGSYLLVLGYAGWQAGQLEQEIMRNDWWVSALDPSFVFDYDADKRLAYALSTLGISYEQLSSSAGRA